MSSTPRSSKRATSTSPPPDTCKRQRRHRTWASIVDTLALSNGIEQDAHRIAQRQKQIDYGKNTLAYDKFSAAWPRHRRQKGHPMTPLARQRCSKRSFGGQLTSWKKKVYEFAAKLEMVDTVDGGETWNRQVGDGGIGDGVDKRDQVCEGRKGGVGDEDGIGNGVGGGDVSAGDGIEGGELEANDESLSDMEDIELDDHGNVVVKAEGDAACAGESAGGGSPACIFDTY